jgi:hypothetical protein
MEDPIPHQSLSVDLVCECEHIAATLVDAYQNPSMSILLLHHLFIEPYIMLVVLPWDAVRYDDRLTIKETGRNEEREERHKNAYPPRYDLWDTVTTKPSLVVDMHGVILAWYLPLVLSRDRQVMKTFICPHLGQTD